MDIRWVQSSNVKCVGCTEKKIKKVLGSWDLEVGSYSYLVAYMEREKSTDF